MNTDQLHDAWTAAAWTAILASLDALRAHLDGDPDLEALRTVAKVAVAAAHDAAARYWQAVEEVNEL